MSNDPKPRMSKKLLLVVSSILVVILLAIVGFVIPSAMSDGTEAYSGAEKAAAQNALSEANASSAGIDKVNRPFNLKDRVEQVKAVKLNDVGCSEGVLSAVNSYLVVVSHRTLFGIQSDVAVVTPCAIKQGQSLEAVYPNL